ncbi:MAG: Mrp/NBP35 family ATP-binding protein [Candidatus Brocadiaceae bacterium]|nr:Mrp/NBP35 family ATP-binding protein [Candidatus Brocadiaceae bacterium]
MQERQEQERRLRQQVAGIKHTVAVMSGKGGVGKSTVAANLAVALAMTGRKVGLLDSDFHGPSVPKILGLDETHLLSDGQKILPAPCGPGLQVMSIAFLLRQKDDAVIWRGPLKMNVLRQFLADVEWGELDYLIVDLPPGTGDEPLSVCQLIPGATGGVVVTTPQELALADVRKCIGFCRQLHLPVLGVVENMSGFVCPHCGKSTDVFGAGGGEAMAGRAGVPFLGRIPLDPTLMQACEDGVPFVRGGAETAAGQAFLRVVEQIIEASESPSAAPNA